MWIWDGVLSETGCYQRRDAIRDGMLSRLYRAEGLFAGEDGADVG